MGAPVNGTVEVSGPEQFHLDELVRQGLAATSDGRIVIADPNARYYSITLSERSLLPGADAQLGGTRFEDWLQHSANQIPGVTLQPAAATVAASKR